MFQWCFVHAERKLTEDTKYSVHNSCAFHLQRRTEREWTPDLNVANEEVTLQWKQHKEIKKTKKTVGDKKKLSEFVSNNKAHATFSQEAKKIESLIFQKTETKDCSFSLKEYS